MYSQNIHTYTFYMCLVFSRASRLCYIIIYIYIDIQCVYTFNFMATQLSYMSIN